VVEKVAFLSLIFLVDNEEGGKVPVGVELGEGGGGRGK